MKKVAYILFGLLLLIPGGYQARAEGDAPSVYVIKKGDTLWGLSEQFLKDPHYWPNLWAKNGESITNPHLIFPGQKLRIFPDHIEIEGTAPAALGAAQPAAGSKAADEPVAEKTYMVSGGEGFLMETGFKPAGFIVSTYQNRQMVGEDDIVYIDLGKAHGAGIGDRFSIFKKMDAISHPVTNIILGNKVIPLGTLQVSEAEDKVSKAIITKSYMEIGAGAFITPYRERKKEVPLKAADRDLSGYIVETKTGNAALAAGDVAYLDLGSSNGVEPGNMLYIVRDVTPDRKFLEVPVDRLPREVIGALVIVETGKNTSTALIVKSIDTVYRGDKVEFKAGK